MFFLRALVHQEAEGRGEAGKKDDGDNLPAILAILRTIKSSEDVVDKSKTEVWGSLHFDTKFGVWHSFFYCIDSFVRGIPQQLDTW